MFGINSKDCKIYNEGVKATEDMIQALPTADVEVVRHGHWIWTENGGKMRYTLQNMLTTTIVTE